MSNAIIEWEDQYGSINAVCVAAIEQMKIDKHNDDTGAAVYINLHNDCVLRTFATYALAKEFYDECCAKIDQFRR